MKTIPIKTILYTTLLTVGLFLAGSRANATNYAGNGSGGFGGHVGNGTLSVTDDGTNITFTIVPTGGNLGGNDLALYIDTGTGGFSTTAGFTDGADGGHTSVSGYSSQGQSVMTFAAGFSPSYAISFSDGYTSLFQLGNGNTGIVYITGQGSSVYSFTIPASSLGLTAGTPATIRIFGTLISGSGYRSSEAIAGSDSGSQGWNPFTQTSFGTYHFAAPPAVSYPVKFSVDMTFQIENGNFNPLNGDTVYASGTFLTNVTQPFQLTPTANTNIYTGTYRDFNSTNTAETFRFSYISVSGSTTNSEGVDSRPFTLLSPGVTNTLVYYDDVFPTNNSATTNNLRFAIDMGPQIYLGHFVPSSGDVIEAYGTFENPKWTAGFQLFQVGNSTVYTNTAPDGNYPGTFENFKYVILSGGVGGAATYESINNRDFFTPTAPALYTFPTNNFNNIANIYTIPVTFQVDMTAQIIAGNFNPGNGDTVSAAGTFQTNVWTAGIFVLTNDITAANTNLYTGTYIDHNSPGTFDQYKFQINPGGNAASANWESIPNRSFVLNSTGMTNPVVFFNNLNPNSILTVPTTVTFTVDMSGAVDVFGNAFNPASDIVVVNGDFLNPQWPNFWTDGLLGGLDYPQNVLNEVGLSTVYTNSFVVPAGNTLEVQYKYGIVHSFTGTGNTNADNEAPAYQNHTRYIRSMPTEIFPTDIFGEQVINPPAATEPPFGNLAIGGLSAGKFPITWLGLPGVYLQYNTNLMNTNWITVTATGGLQSTNWSNAGTSQYFRLVKP